MARIARRMSEFKQSAAILVSQRARDLVAAGCDIIALGTGEPDFDTPDNIKEAAVDAIRQGRTKYTAVDGIPELKTAIVAKFQRENGLSFDVSQISVAAGGKQIISNALAATLDPGDEVIIPAPYWMSYPDMVKLWGGTPVIVDCPQSQGFKLTPAALADALGAKTKWLILNSPSNPTGAAYSAAELRELGLVLRAHPQVTVMSDDIYERILFDGREFANLARACPDLRGRVLIVNGVSKTYCMTGWRLGYAAGPSEIVKAMAVVQGQTTTHPSSISQAAAVEALNGSQAIVAQLRSAYQARRDRAVPALKQADGIECLTPDGAFYLYPSCAGVLGKRAPDGRHIETDEDFAVALLDCEGVAVVHGEAFGLSPHFRISIAASDAALEEACRRIRRFCASLS